ncbi:YnbE family lipoprotein [Bisgaard Taxon 10/6]|uniref:YnbE family lipoprotein n=1 Tax=Exercitatus varius TaxID=67857 RepID=UPI00294B57CF|nr:YnbE family lipoprotein [Exercitatus varius]MDG2954600.1 YnbE family lipoprotein [Exercitatus varius]
MKKLSKFRPHFFSQRIAFGVSALLFGLTGLTGCTPTVQLETPKEGITINMNVVVDHNISVKMDEKTQDAVAEVEAEAKQQD